jgi:hypothetical protein
MMAITVDWLVKGRVCYITLPSVVDDEALQNHEIAMSHWLDQAEDNVYVIADVSAMKKVLSLKQIIILKHMRHPRLTHAMTVGLSLNPMARFVVPLVAQTVGLQYKDFATREEARTYISEVLGA